MLSTHLLLLQMLQMHRLLQLLHMQMLLLHMQRLQQMQRLLLQRLQQRLMLLHPAARTQTRTGCFPAPQAAQPAL
jgi:hypothetical protein